MNQAEHRSRAAAVALAVLASGGACPNVSGQVSYAVFDLGTLGGAMSRANAINHDGQIVGKSGSITVPDNAYLWEKGVMVALANVEPTCASEAFDISDDGQIVIEAGVRDVFCTYNAYLWKQGALTPLGALGEGLRSYPEGINGFGEIVGNSRSFGLPNPAAFLWLPVAAHGLPAGMNDLGALPGHVASYAYAVNDRGEVVGYSLNTGGTIHRAFLWLPIPAYGLPIGMNDLGTLGGPYSHGLDINENGEVVGSSVNQNGFDVAFHWANGVMTDLDTLGSAGLMSVANGINESGTIVGRSMMALPPPDEEHACLWHGAQPGPDDLNDLPYLPADSTWTLRAATDINDLGQIVGWGIVQPGGAHAFLLTPLVPSDFDADGDVDLDEVVFFLGCFTGPDGGPPASGCEVADLDGDGDVDKADFGYLQKCFSGSGVPAMPGC